MILIGALAALVVPNGAPGATYAEDVTLHLSIPGCAISSVATRCETTLEISAGAVPADRCMIAKPSLIAPRCRIENLARSGPGVVAVAVEGSCQTPSIRFEPEAGRGPLDVRLRSEVGLFGSLWHLQGVEIFLTDYRHDSQGDHWRFSREPGRRSYAYFVGSSAGPLFLEGTITSSGSDCAAGVGAMSLVAHHIAVVTAEDLP